MATYAYDDFQVTFTPAAAGGYDMVAEEPSGAVHRTHFAVPLPAEQLEQAVLSIAARRSRTARLGPTSREVGPAAESVELDAEQVGAALADALFADGVGAAYDAARDVSNTAQRGLRLTLSLASAPALISLPWEFLYRRPRFIASQRHSPLVRRLDTGTRTAPPGITGKVRILGVISSPSDLSPLEVDVERGRVEQAVAKMVTARRVQLDWLEPATPSSLRRALRDSSYHILHYVGHSSFTNNDEGAIYLEDEAGAAVEVDSTVLANLLSDQNSLRLVVLNSCEGARTTLSDPYAGVATTLIQLGVPAVVAMQFEISDQAAILFADELYTNLIGRQDPIDAAVAEARKAIYVEIDRVEWATPVLFVRDPDVQLFDFKVPVAPLPPPPPPGVLDDGDERLRTPEQRAVTGEQPVVPLSHEPPAPPRAQPQIGTRRRWPIVAGAGAAVVALGVGALIATRDDGNGGAPTDTAATVVSTSAQVTIVPVTSPGTSPDTAPNTQPNTTPDTQAPVILAPRPRTGFLSVEVLEPGGDTHLYPLVVDTGVVGIITTKAGATDTEGVWDHGTNRVAFTRSLPASGQGTSINYVVPGNFQADQGKPVAPLIPWTVGTFDHAPAWTADGALLYAETDGCAPARGCAETLRRATFSAADDGSGFLDALSVRSDDAVVVGQFLGIAAIAADPVDADRAVVADATGLWLVVTGQQPVQFQATDVTPLSVTYTGDGSRIVAVFDAPRGGQVFGVWTSEGKAVQAAAVVGDKTGGRFVSITADPSNSTILGLSTTASGGTLSRLQVTSDGELVVTEVITEGLLAAKGTPQAINL